MFYGKNLTRNKTGTIILESDNQPFTATLPSRKII